MAEQTTEQAIAEIWKLFKETDAKFKETDAKFKETDTRLDERFAETQAEISRTNRNLQKLEGLFGNQWGRLIESLVQPGVLALFQGRGHDVHRLHQRSKAKLNGTTMEIDIILEDQTEVIPIEVKTNLNVEHVNDFLADLAEFTRFFPLYSAYHIYGAVAGLDISQDVIRYAYRRGLFVVSVTGTDLVEILNDEKFQPKDFGATDSE
ncbi:MAG: DUF3782 domain-containing protein [Chloroflexota bacterium]